MKFRYLLACSSFVLLTACGGGSSNSDSGSGSGTGSNTGSLSVSLTDAPVDEAVNVFVTLRGISLNLNDSGWVDHDFDSPEKIDLLTLQAGNSISLFEEDGVEAGSYEVRLNLYSDDDNEPDHYIVIEEDGAEHELFIPSGDQTGLKLGSTITVTENGTADYTIDFDVRQSVVLRGNQNNNNGYLLKPVLRLIDNSGAGSISGVIADASLLTADCSDEDPLTHNVIYVFEGADVTPDDYGSDGAQAVTTAIVNFDEDSGIYSYTTAPLPVGEYTISLTCNSDLEDVAENDELLFKATENKTVVADVAEDSAAEETDETEEDLGAVESEEGQESQE